MPDTPRLRRWLLTTALLGMTISNGIVFSRSRVPMLQGYGDFSSFYTAGVLVNRGLGDDLYNRAQQWKVQQEFFPALKRGPGPLPYIRPPFEALLFSVFARWPYSTALSLWIGFNLALLFAIPFIATSDGSWREPFPRWAAGFLSLGTFPVLINLLLGQDAALVAFLVAICFWQLTKGRDKGAGFTLGLALFKFPLVVPLVAILWIAGRKRVLPGFAASAFVVITISAATVGWRGLIRYPGYLLALNQTKGVGVVTPEIQMNLRGLLTFFVGRSPYPGRIHWILAPVALAAIVYTGLIWRKAGVRWVSEGFGLALIVSIVTSYYAHDYDLLSLAVPLLAMRTRPATAPRADRLTRYLEAVGLLLLLFTPLYWFLRVQLKSECLMTLPLLAVGLALARRLCRASVAIGDGQRAAALELPQ